jgi:membrane protease YdiL (CAAX protease family)
VSDAVSAEESHSAPGESAAGSSRPIAVAILCAAAAGMFTLANNLSHATISVFRYVHYGPQFISQIDDGLIAGVSQQSITLIFGLCAFYLARAYWFRKSEFQVGRGQALLIACLYPVIVLAAALFSRAILGGLSGPHQLFQISIDLSAVAVAGSINTMVLVPIVEEILFRGWLFDRLADLKVPSAHIIFLTTISWIFIHHMYLSRPVLLMGYGAALGYGRLRSNGLIVPIFMHSGINVAAGFLE